MAAPYQQDLDFRRSRGYKTRVDAAKLFGRFMDADREYTSTFVVTIKPTAEDKELDEDTVSGIVGSLMTRE